MGLEEGGGRGREGPRAALPRGSLADPTKTLSSSLPYNNAPPFTAAISKIVAEEAAKRGIPYVRYGTLPEITAKFMAYMAAVGAAEQEPADAAVTAQLARL